MPTASGPRSRRFTPCVRAAAWIASASIPLTVIVSKKFELTRRPAERSPAASTTALRWIRRAIRRKPSGPW